MCENEVVNNKYVKEDRVRKEKYVSNRRKILYIYICLYSLDRQIFLYKYLYSYIIYLI